MTFDQWKQQYAPNDSGEDYDLRGAFDAGVTPDASGHWPDAFKRPNHPTFSNHSIYARAGRWTGDKWFVPTYSGEVWIDDDGGCHFKFHIQGGDFLHAREALVKFIACLQSRLDTEQKCPFYEPRDSSI